MKLTKIISETKTPEQELEWLEDDYPHQTPYFKKQDLIKINNLRKQLGLPQVDTNLKPLTNKQTQTTNEKQKQQPQQITKTNKNNEAIVAYQTYLKKEKSLEPHRIYNKLIINATTPLSGKTPVKPLATMGTNGDQILCDLCKQPIIIEGGKYHGMDAKTAFNLSNGRLTHSYILGGVVFLTESNGTLRVYHDYSPPCSRKEAKIENDKRASFTTPYRPHLITKKVRQFLKDEGLDPELETKILQANYSYDPGIGINRP